jgi:hypothetical protein
MRAMTQPQPSSCCEQCGGDLRLKLIAATDRGLALDYEIFVCANCGREQSLTVGHVAKIRTPRRGQRSSCSVAYGARSAQFFYQ